MEGTDFVAEGELEVGPSARYFVFLGREYLGQRPVDHFGLPSQQGYTRFGRVRVTVELLGEAESYRGARRVGRPAKRNLCALRT